MLGPDQITKEALAVVNEAFLGLLTTVGSDGVPCSRWMGSAVIGNNLSSVYTLTPSGTRKLAHLAHNDNVCWVFSSPEFSDVVTLIGKARVLRSPMVAQQVWDRLMECVRLYCMSALSDDTNLELVTIEVQVRRIELLSPRLHLYQTVTVELAQV
jgi:general stress protein 26